MKIILVLKIFSVLFIACNGVDVKTSSGLVRGSTISVFNRTIDQFLGIPYAVPPLGDLRFRKPKPIGKPLEGIIDATKKKLSCIQKYEDYVGPTVIGEDCLTLNIWSPKSANTTELKPVLFWIYGGILVAGSIFQDNMNGSVLATKDVLLVSANYRLGALGFLYSGDESAPGNVGFYDQQLALKWVQENIHLFGGDKNKVTIFGVSAGSWSVSAQLMSPLSKGLYKRAILQSGAIVNYKNYGDGKAVALSSAKQFAQLVNCTDDKLWMDCLKKVDAKHFTNISEKIFNVVYGTEILPLNAQEAYAQGKVNKDIDIIAGVTKDEGSSLVGIVWPEVYTKNVTALDLVIFLNAAFNRNKELTNVKNITEYYLRGVNASDSKAIKWKIFDLFGDYSMKCPTYLFAKWYVNQSQPNTNVYFYELTHAAIGARFWDNVELGIVHGSDMPFTFGLLLLNSTTKPENVEMSKQFITMWTDFAKTGKPDQNWPQLIDVKAHSSVTHIKDLNPKDTKKYFTGLFDESCDGVWNSYFQL